MRTGDELKEAMMDGFGVLPQTARRVLKKIGEDFIVSYSL
jgi:hypothetical protein